MKWKERKEREAYDRLHAKLLQERHDREQARSKERAKEEEENDDRD